MSCDSQCEQLRQILNGDKAMVENGVCVVDQDRNIQVTILGHSTNSPLVIQNEFTFEPVDSGDSLDLAEIVLTESEVQQFVDKIANQGIIISAIHNHWLFDEPRLIYIHLEAIMAPEEFAMKVAQALEGINV